MDYQFVPSVRVTVDSMKASIIHAMGLNGSELGDVIQTRVDAALGSAIADDAIDDAVYSAINSAVKSYFSHGPGGIAIKEAIATSLDDLIPHTEKP